MIKVKSNIKEAKYFCDYLLATIAKPCSADKVKEYLLATAIVNLHNKINKKYFNATHIALVHVPDYKQLTISIEDNEMLALSIYFNRYELPTFLLKLQNDILTKMPGEIINVLTNK